MCVWDWGRKSMDTLSKEERSKRMALIRAKDTGPEMVVRRLVHGMGYRYRLHCKDIPGTPDIVFRRKKKAIFVHGCFWHGHSDPSCRLARLPKSRLEFWEPKLSGNRQRDIAVQEALTRLGWRVLIVWECLTGRTEELKENIRAFLEESS